MMTIIDTPASLRVLEDGTTIPSIPLTNESKSLSPSTAIIARLQQANIAYLRHLGQAWQPTQSATPSVNGDRDSVGALASEDHRIDTQIKAAKRRIRKALLEYYRNIRLLQNYRTLNQSGFVKILKKFDKMADRKFKDYYLKKMEDYDFAHSDSIQQTQGRAEVRTSSYYKYLSIY
ncbi:SPX domain-containing protein [Syncephalis fuscata]|nr:SPX domain-containing protein [Syncephalis fuscata]